MTGPAREAYIASIDPAVLALDSAVMMEQGISEDDPQQLGPAPDSSTPNQGFPMPGSPIQIGVGESEQ